jgi:hypothetical protein
MSRASTKVAVLCLKRQHPQFQFETRVPKASLNGTRPLLHYGKYCLMPRTVNGTEVLLVVLKLAPIFGNFVTFPQPGMCIKDLLYRPEIGVLGVLGHLVPPSESRFGKAKLSQCLTPANTATYHAKSTVVPAWLSGRARVS